MYSNEERNHEHSTENEAKIPSFFRFEDLRVYHKSMDYLVWLQEMNLEFPESENSHLAARFNDAARNITFYIVEGSTRNKSQFIHYLKMSKSAIHECLVFTSLAFRANYISDASEDFSRNLLMELTKMTSALISSLQRSMGTNNSGEQRNHYNNGNQNSSPRSQFGDTMTGNSY